MLLEPGYERGLFELNVGTCVYVPTFCILGTWTSKPPEGWQE